MSRLTGVRAKVERAREHFGVLHDALEQYLDSDPYRVVEDTEEGTGRSVYRLRIDTEPPTRLNAIAGDVVHNLRAALDHLAYALVLESGGSPGRHTEYPICDSKGDLGPLVNGRLKGASNWAKELTRRFRPYRGGTPGFWELKELDNRDKHRLLVTLAASNKTVVLDFAEGLRKAAREAGHMEPESIPDMPLGIRPADPCVENGEPLYKGAPGEEDADPNVEQFDMTLGLKEPGVIDCEPLEESLLRLGRFIQHVVQVYERRCF